MRVAGYTPLRDYAAIGDGRTVALVARDGSIDWLCLPDLDSPSVFGALLDSERGGSFRLAPTVPFEAAQRYVPETNVLETTFSTAEGVVRVADAISLTGEDALEPTRELTRRIDGDSGSVPIDWAVEPRFDYGAVRPRIESRAGVPVASAGGDAVAVCSWSAGEPACRAGEIGGRFVTSPGSSALISLGTAHGQPLVFSSRSEVEERFDQTVSFWQRWAGHRSYDGPWRDAVIRSALALKLLVHAPSGAIAAAATTSLPEAIGGERNWDYRYSWVRDSSFTLDALGRLGCAPEVEAFFWWLLHASQLTHPDVNVLYGLRGGVESAERDLPLDGYRGSRPVRVGNGASEQRQLDVFGHLLHTAWLYAEAGGRIDRDTGRRLAGTADLVCRIWRERDSGIWEVRSQPQHFTQSKVMCWVALDRAVRLAGAGRISERHALRWREEAAAIREFVDARCWSEAKQSYVRFAGGEELDASLLFTALMDYPGGDRVTATVEAVRRELAHGPLVYRYTGEDGLAGGEGAFLTCSFWLVEALARRGRVGAAAALMEDLVAAANDVGLYAEEVDVASGAFLGNLPQGLVHLALISAAVAIADAGGR